MSDHRSGAGVLEEVAHVLFGHEGVAHTEDAACFQNPEPRVDERDSVGQKHEHAILDVDAARREGRAGPVRALLHLPVRPALLPHGDGGPVALPLAHARVEEVIGHVESLGDLEEVSHGRGA